MDGPPDNKPKSLVLRYVPKQLGMRTVLAMVTVFAIVLAIRTQIPFDLDEIRGIQILESKTDGDYRFLFKPQATEKTAETVMRFLEDGGSLFFYDSRYPKLSDPGAYVKIQKISGDRCIVKYANHGWSGLWFYVTLDEARQYLWECVPDNSSYSKHQMLAKGMHFSNDRSAPPVDSKVKKDPNYSGYVFFKNQISTVDR